MDAQEHAHLLLDVEQQLIELSEGELEQHGVWSLGTGADNQLVHGGRFASRRHAHIERSHNDFYLVDTSTNGTYVQTEDEQVTHVHRARMRLWGAGWISLGEPLHSGRPIHFKQH